MGVKVSTIVVIGISEVKLLCRRCIGHFEVNVDLLHVKQSMFQKVRPLTCAIVIMLGWLILGGP